MKRLWKHTLLMLAASTLATSASAATFRIGHVFDGTHPFHVAAIEAAERFKACTGGQHSFDVYPASQLGSDAEMQEQILIGGLDATLAGFIFAANTYQPLAIAAAPFLFKDREHALRYQDSDLYREGWKGWEEATGQHILSSAFFGFFNVTSKAPINTPDDMKGLKIRVPNTAIYLAFPEALGASPTPIPLHEVYLALQQGVADASANGLSMTYANRFYEVQNYVNLTGHMADFTLWISSDAMVNQLDDAGKACLNEAAELWGERGTQLVFELEAKVREELEANKAIEFNEVDRAAFQEATEGSILGFGEMLGVSPETIEAIRGL